MAIISALALPALLGSFGLGTEVASWYANQRAMQNAADSAALAAATNASTNFDTEAKAVAAHYGYSDGKDGVVVLAKDAVPCPAGGNDCYSVTITKSLPLYLAQFVGFGGDDTVNGAPAKKILAVAVATQGLQPRPYCLVALGTNGVTLNGNGGPFADLSGCNIASNGDATCNGHNLGADVGDAHGVNSGCGVVPNSNQPLVDDIYASLAENIPPDNKCNGSFPADNSKPGKGVGGGASKGGSTLPAENQLSGPLPWGSIERRCGDVKLTGDVTITNTGDPTVLVIYNGDLNLSGYKLSTAPGAHLTIIFAGDNGYSHIPTGGGAFDYQAPEKGQGDWAGVAMYQAPNLTSGVDVTAAGNSPTWDITGLVYMPHSSVTLSGAVNKSSNGASCFALVVNDITINGTGSILAHGECDRAGLVPPSNQVPSRGQLVS